MKRVILAVVCLLAASSARAGTVGQCNALLGQFGGDYHQVANGLDVTGNCNDLFERLGNFVNAGCVPLLDSGQLFSAHIRPDLPPIQTACTSLVCACGFDIPECTGVVSCQ